MLYIMLYIINYRRFPRYIIVIVIVIMLSKLWYTRLLYKLSIRLLYWCCCIWLYIFLYILLFI